ncbi:MAG: tungstate ABC transporter substrate-binding protein WtpA [Actinobacteria bacterium]|nr:tungstate ABC transporter substrate-binding protein WtpA [Actinomycetota bacterium]
MKLIYAGSLIVPFERLATEFEHTHPGVDVLTESHGSIQVLRHVTELGDRFDMAVSADEQLIPPLMYDRVDHETGKPYASWYCTFATNRMVLAISPKSALAGEFNARTWYQRLTQPDVRFGLADPRFDAAGYRALMLLQLAEREYDDPYLFEDMMMGRFTKPVTVTRDTAGVDVIEVPEILETQRGSTVVLRGASIQLVALLESGDLDCAFEYESVARQHGLKYVRLPASIDLGEQRFRSVYRTVEVKLDFQRFASVKPVFRGEVIRYAFTIPANAPDPGLAAEFATFLLGDDGRRILEEDWQPVLEPPTLDNAAAAPEEVRQACGGSR